MYTALALVLSLTPAASRQLTAIRVSGGDDLQAALDRARPGDTVLLAAGARFSGNFVLRSRGDANAFITLRTDSDRLPGPGTRISPAASGTLAVLQSPNQSPALRTAPGANHWRVENVEFRGNAGGRGDIIALGQGGAAQRQLDVVPRALVFDRVYVHGDPQLGQKRGLSLNSADTRILNSYFSDIKAVGQDTQAIAGWNGPGPFVIENNYLEAGAENLLFGGSDPEIEGLVPTGITIRRNHLTRPLSWRDPLVATPSDVRGAAAEGGALASGDYTYRVVAERPVSGDPALSAPSEPVTVTIAEGTSGSATLTWPAVTGAASYRVYRHGTVGGDVMWKNAASPFTDSGAPATAGTAPKRASVWTVKNLLELKNARDVVIEGNVLEHNWAQSQSGAAILFTPRNQSGGAPWSRVENVRFEHNIVRSSAAGIALSGADDLRPSATTRGIVIRNNLFVGLDGPAYGGNGDWIRISHGPEDVTIERNTVSHSGRVLAISGNKRLSGEVTDLVFRGNVVRHNRYGVLGVGSSPGLPTLAAYLPGVTFSGNIIAGGRAGSYPKDNVFVTEDEFSALFANAAAGDYRLKDEGLRGVGVDLAALEAATGVRTIEITAPGTSPPGTR